MYFVHRRTVFTLVLVLVLAAIPAVFQNCAGEYKAITQKSESSQCLAEKRAKSLAARIAEGPLDCTNLANFHCLKRTYKPGIENNQIIDDYCFSGRGDCIQVTFVTHDTETARDPASIADGAFEPGGYYNRSDVSCAYQEGEYVYLSADGDEIESTFAQVSKSCRETAQENAE